MGVRGIKVDTSRIGLEMFYKPYIAICLKRLWHLQMILKKWRGEGSGALWQFYNAYAEKDTSLQSRSRASIIFAMNDLVEQGVLDFNDATGKGGHHRLYYPVMSPLAYRDWIELQVDHALKKTFEGEWWTL